MFLSRILKSTAMTLLTACTVFAQTAAAKASSKPARAKGAASVAEEQGGPQKTRM
jgi:hypothetical protein